MFSKEIVSWSFLNKCCLCPVFLKAPALGVMRTSVLIKNKIKPSPPGCLENLDRDVSMPKGLRSLRTSRQMPPFFTV